MIQKILCIGLLLISMAVKAHQPDISTTMLVEKENNIWVLQISASLSAFQQEIKMHNAETPYKTPEEFKQMVLEHIKNNFSLVFNGDQSVTLSNGFVQLGHETKVVFELKGIPSEQKSVVVKNIAFNDIYKSRSTLAILKSGFTKERFVLNDDNHHTLDLKAQENKFVLHTAQEASFFEYQNVFIVLCIVGLGLFVKRLF